MADDSQYIHSLIMRPDRTGRWGIIFDGNAFIPIADVRLTGRRRMIDQNNIGFLQRMTTAEFRKYLIRTLTKPEVRNISGIPIKFFINRPHPDIYFIFVFEENVGPLRSARRGPSGPSGPSVFGDLF
jgi:hypothetical protein